MNLETMMIMHLRPNICQRKKNIFILIIFEYPRITTGSTTNHTFVGSICEHNYSHENISPQQVSIKCTVSSCNMKCQQKL